MTHDAYREVCTPTRLQYRLTGHWLQNGEMGRQRCCPKGTNQSLNVIQYFAGSLCRRARSVSSGILVRT